MKSYPALSCIFGFCPPIGLCDCGFNFYPLLLMHCLLLLLCLFLWSSNNYVYKAATQSWTSVQFIQSEFQRSSFKSIIPSALQQDHTYFSRAGLFDNVDVYIPLHYDISHTLQCTRTTRHLTFIAIVLVISVWKKGQITQSAQLLQISKRLLCLTRLLWMGMFSRNRLGDSKYSKVLVSNGGDIIY